jgi:hypothetical protein
MKVHFHQHGCKIGSTQYEQTLRCGCSFFMMNNKDVRMSEYL